MNITVNQRREHIHNQDGVANAFNIAATQTNKSGKNAESDSKNYTAFFGQRAGNSVGSHEKGTNHQPAAK